MKVHATAAGTGLRASLTALSFGIVAILASAAISACTGGTSPPVGLPTSSPSGTATATSTATPTSSATATPTATATATSPAAAAPADTTSPTPTPTVTPSPTVTPIPTAAPPTGGGGTAGFQHGLLLFLGVLAVLVGAGIIYRRRIIRNR